MKRSGPYAMLCVLACLTWAMVFAVGAPGQAQTAPDAPTIAATTPAPATAPAASSAAQEPAAPSAAGPVADLWAGGIAKAKDGKFDEGIEKLREALKLDPENKDILAADSLLEGYRELHGQWIAGHQAEFDHAAKRVGQCLMAQEYRPTLAKNGQDKPLRERIFEIAAAYSNGPNSDTLDRATAENIDDLKSQIEKAYQKQSAALAKAVEILKDNDSEYANTFRTLAAKLELCLAEYAKAWAAAQAEPSKARADGVKALKPLEEKLIDALEPLDALVTEQPWRNGLIQARLAKMVNPDRKAQMVQYPWYRELVVALRAKGAESMKADKWYDALSVYSGLADLEPYDEEYRGQLRIARRHVRVVGLYGKPDANTPLAAAIGLDANAPGASKAAKIDPNATAVKPVDEIPPEAADEVPETRWQELVDGADADIVMQAISQIEDQYVTAVDYRKLAQGALMAVKVLAEAPQVANTFPGLADKAKKQAFLDAIERELTSLAKADRVDHIYLQMLLNTVLRESENSVDIPVAVLAVEFTDGFIEKLDRFTVMVWPSEVEQFKKEITQEFFGVGIQISKEANEPLKVVTPLANSPAFREGIKAGDQITAVDGKRTDPAPIDKLVKMIMGPKGTKVVLTVKSRGMAPREVTLVRDAIQVRTVKGWKRQPGGDGDNWDYLVDPAAKIGYIRITQFTEQTSGDLDKALAGLREIGCRSLILDLRGNPGGLLEVSKKVADEFLTMGAIVSTRGRSRSTAPSDATPGGEYIAGDMVVLVNDMSASAAEIVSGAMQDWRRAVIVGQRTFGKGSVQNVIQIPRHSAVLKLTTAHYYLPSGRLLHREDGAKTWGVDPDVEIPMTPRETRHWMELRHKTDLLQDMSPEELDADMAQEYKLDIQLDTAVMLLKLMKLQEVKPAEKSVAEGR